MNKLLSCLILSLLLVGCNKDVDYLPGFEYVDEKKCHIKNESLSTPLIVYLVKGYDLEVTDDNLFLKNIQKAVERGCNINEPDSDGLSPLNTAILFSQMKMIEVLIELGADPHLTINTPKKSIFGKNSFELAEWLMTNDLSEERRKTNNLIHKYQ